MKRRSFLKLLGVFAATTAVDPTALLVESEPPLVVGEIAAEPVPAYAFYDLMPASRLIYPIYSPMRNKLPRVAGA